MKARAFLMSCLSACSFLPVRLSARFQCKSFKKSKYRIFVTIYLKTAARKGNILTINDRSADRAAELYGRMTDCELCRKGR